MKHPETEAEAPKRNTLRLINHGLTGIVALLAVYIMAAPYLPQLTWWLRHDSPVQGLVPRATKSEPKPSDFKGKDNTLFIPALDMTEQVYDGNARALNLGVWHLPHSSSPDKGGNTVFVGHRFTYSGQAVFYHLDKVKLNDTIKLIWRGKLYTYQVSNILTVPASQVSIEANTQELLLTIYTCTPLWSAKDRLVIQAHLVEVSS